MKYIIAIFSLSALLFSCTTPKEKEVITEEITKVETMKEDNSLKSKLEEKKGAFNEKASDEKKKIYSEGIDAVEQSGVLASAKQIGDIAPNFTLKNAQGNDVQLYDLLEDGPVVLTWYRGGWCPYCNITLNALQESLPDFKSAGAQLIALTPEVPDSSLNTSEKHNLEFEVLSDLGNVVAKEYGVVFELTNEVATIYQNAFDLHGFNGDESNELPLAATYIINSDKQIVYSFLDKDYRNRAEPSVLIEVLKGL